MRIVNAAQAVLNDRLVDDAWVAWEGEHIVATGQGTPPAAPERSFSDGVLLPGFVDIHCHGGGGGEFASDDVHQARSAAQAHLRHGSTTLVASLVTADPDTLLRSIETLSMLVDDGTIAGIHLEGPWLSRTQCGAHDAQLVHPPDPAEIARVLTVARGRISMVTLAPELPGAIEAIEQLCDSGVVVAVGHTDCDYATAIRAVNAGATIATHLFNCMPALDKRKPGPVLALMADPRVTVELICDGVHIDEALLRFVVMALGADRIAAVTDAMSGADAPDGDYLLGGLAVAVGDGVARIQSSGALAGSTLTMDRAMRVWVQRCGVSMVDASRMCSTTPSDALGLQDRGRLDVGLRADLVILDDALNAVAVLRGGQWVHTAPRRGDFRKPPT